MKNADIMTPGQLDSLMQTMPDKLPKIKKWQRVDCGKVETYLGDNLIVVALVEEIPLSPAQCKTLQYSTRETVIKYLQSEGFIGEEYYYVGIQKFQLKDL